MNMEKELSDGAELSAALQTFVDVMAVTDPTRLNRVSLFFALVTLCNHYFDNELEHFIKGLRDCNAARPERVKHDLH